MGPTNDEISFGPNYGEVILSQNIFMTEDSDAVDAKDENFSMTADSAHDTMKNSEAVAGSFFAGKADGRKNKSRPISSGSLKIFRV